MKAVMKLVGGLIIGILFGLSVAAMLVVMLTDTTFTEFLGKLQSADAMDAIRASLVGMASFLIALLILIPAHELGHLVCGLLSGYEFVSFRVFNLTIIKADGKMRIKRYAIAGTGGQCLLVPPDRPLEHVPTAWYNAGGVVANILLLMVAVPLLWVDMDPLLFEALVVFCITDAFIILMNGIPMKMGGIGNDAYNMIYLRRNLLSKRALVMQLRTNALIQNGMRPKDMPDGWFEWTTDVDFSNPLEVSVPLMYASRVEDQMKWEDAYRMYEELYQHKSDIIQLYVNEISCELAFCAMMTGRLQRASELLDADLLKYINAYAGVMSAKQRILGAKALYLDNDPELAERIYRKLEDSKGVYLLQGEVESDLEIMRSMLSI